MLHNSKGQPVGFTFPSEIQYFHPILDVVSNPRMFEVLLKVVVA